MLNGKNILIIGRMSSFGKQYVRIVMEINIQTNRLSPTHKELQLTKDEEI